MRQRSRPAQVYEHCVLAAITYIATGKIANTKGFDRLREKEVVAYVSVQDSSFLKMKIPMRKMVLDSDDEEETSPQPLPTKGFIPINSDTSYPTCNPPHNSEGPSTGSTEQLSREIQDATKKLLDPTPDGTRSTGKLFSSPEQPLSSPAVSKLRRATTNFVEGKEKKLVKTYGKQQVQDDSGLGRKSGARIEVESPSWKKVREIAEFQDQQDQDSHINPRTNGPKISLPPSLSKGFKNTQNFESCMIVTGQNHSLSNLSRIDVSTNSEIIESTDLPRTPTKLGKPRREMEEPNQLSLPDGVSEPPRKRRKLGDDDDTVFSSQDQLSMTSPRVAATDKKLKPEKSQKESKVIDDTHGMDEIAIGLPPEQYNPRPSRSRSGHGDASLFLPEDFSKKPGSLAKLKRRKNRRKTTAFERPPEDSEEEAIAQVRDFIKKETSSNPAADAVKPLLKPMEESLQTVEPMKKVDPSKRNQVNEKIEEYGPVVTLFSEEQPSKGISSTANGMKHVQEHGLSKIIETEIPPPKHQSLLEIETAQSITTQPSSTRHASKIRKPSLSPLPDYGDDGDDTPSSDRPVSQNSKKIPLPQQQFTPSSSPSPIKQQPPSPQTPLKPAAAGPDKHSPLNSSKVAYRVGLSKRARIEPLLRIVRKP